eukprot:7576202-Pyramimonas_sp.AAC.2
MAGLPTDVRAVLLLEQARAAADHGARPAAASVDTRVEVLLWQPWEHALVEVEGGGGGAGAVNTWTCGR